MIFMEDSTYQNLVSPLKLLISGEEDDSIEINEEAEETADGHIEDSVGK